MPQFEKSNEKYNIKKVTLSVPGVIHDLKGNCSFKEGKRFLI